MSEVFTVKESVSAKDNQAPQKIEEFVQGLLPSANKPNDSSQTGTGFG